MKEESLEIRDDNAPVAYTLTGLPFGITLDIRTSANAWWMDQTKVYKLFAAFGIRATIVEACSYADITLRQYKYFASIYPEVNEIRKGSYLAANLQAKKNIMKALQDGDLKISKWIDSKSSFGSFSSEEKEDPDLIPEKLKSLREQEIGGAVKEFNEKMRKILTKKPE